MTRFQLLSDICSFLHVGRRFLRKNGSVIYSYICYWALPALSLSDPSPSESVTLSCCLLWDLVPSYRLLRLAGLRWRYSNLPLDGLLNRYSIHRRCIAPVRTEQRTILHIGPLLLHASHLILPCKVTERGIPKSTRSIAPSLFTEQ
jgi:hypothetical protein